MNLRHEFLFGLHLPRSDTRKDLVFLKNCFNINDKTKNHLQDEMRQCNSNLYEFH